LSYTVDPSHDTPSILKQYASKFDAKSPKWQFLTGDKKAIYRLAIDGYKISVADAAQYDKKIQNLDEMFIHSEKLILIDKKGHIRGYYDGTDKTIVEDELMAEIKILLDNYKK
jgi:protein SCO1